MAQNNVVPAPYYSNSNTIPANPGHHGYPVIDRDAHTNAPIDYFWNGDNYVSSQLFVAGVDGGTVTSVGAAIGSIITGSSDYNKSIPAIAIANKVLIERISILTYVTATLGTTNSNYFTVSSNKLHGCDSNNQLMSMNMATDFTTRNVVANTYYNYQVLINSVFNGRMDNWQMTFTKTGLGVIQLRINPVLEYRIIRV